MRLLFQCEQCGHRVAETLVARNDMTGGFTVTVRCHGASQTLDMTEAAITRQAALGPLPTFKQPLPQQD